jgi:hypothetical protein
MAIEIAKLAQNEKSGFFVRMTSSSDENNKT